MVAGSGDRCPHCNTAMAADQRYCLECGHGAAIHACRSWTPWFSWTPPNPRAGRGAASAAARSRKPRISANASLIAGIATLILAIGVGVLIGRSGDSGSAPVASNTPQVIKVEGGGGGGGASEGAGTGSKGPSVGGGAPGKKKKKAATASGAEKAGEEAQDEVLKTNPNVHLAPPTQKIGGECEKGTAGCSNNGKFEGEFFGE